MPDLSEFIAFVSEKSGVKNRSLIQKDLLIHRILKTIYSSEHFAANYVFKGGSCLVKCYFGYYRFSVDLDFTWKDQKDWKDLGKYALRRKLNQEIQRFGSFLEEIAKSAGLQFKSDLKDERYFEFGSGSRMATLKMWKNSELLKTQVNFVEETLFPPKTRSVKTLLDAALVSKEESAYFEEFLAYYKPFEVTVYDEKEILCEKVRAILTRRTQKLRDLYDLFILDKFGFKIEDFKEEILKKTQSALHFKRYRANLKKNRESLDLMNALEDPFERELFVIRPPKEFDSFLKRIAKLLIEIMENL